MNIQKLARPFALLAPALLLATPATSTPIPGGGPDGVCTMEEEAAGLCFQSASGFVVEAMTGDMGEFPILTPAGNSEFSYLITGLGAGGCNAVSHADIQVPVCVSGDLEVVSTIPESELLTNGQGDPSCNYGNGDLDHDVLKWDVSVPCDGAVMVTVVFAGVVEAELQEFLLKNGTDCEVNVILGPSCEVDFPSTGEPYCYGNGCPCGNEDPNAGCANSTGQGGLLTGTGSTSIAANNLTMTATNLVPNQTALLFAGDLALNGGSGRAFGDGLRCAGVNAVRLHVGLPDDSGTFACGPGVIGLDADPMPGDIRRMQVWYRDPSGGPCNSGFNLTNGVELTYMP